MKEETELRPIYDGKKSFYKKANVREEEGKIILKSYHTDVCFIKNERAFINDVFSPTTLRHIKEFLKQNNFKADTKSQILKDYYYNEDNPIPPLMREKRWFNEINFKF